MTTLTDKLNMKTKELIPLILKVLSNPKVIGVTIAMILVIAFANFIVNYSKKPKAPKVKKVSEPAPAAPQEPKADISESEA